MKKRFVLRIIGSCAMLVSAVLLRAPPLLSEPSGKVEERVKVFVSIVPQAYFVERVGGDHVDVAVMVGAGHSPATYEPRPQQMAELSRAKLYFRIGVPFENIWIERISKANTSMKIVDTRRGIDLLPMKAHGHPNHEGHHHHDKGIKDPHIWLSLKLVKVQAENICHALIAQDPAHKSYYEDHLIAFQRDLDELDAEISRTLKTLKTRRFMVFHPAWGYFAHDYGLEQVAIEAEGKEPGAKALAHLNRQARQQEIKVVFVQKQFSKKSADTVAHAIGGRVIQLDPLAKEYLNNMRKIAQTFAQVMR